MHKSFNLIRAEIDAAKELIKIGAEYEHYKNPGKYYLVKQLVIDEATDEVWIEYSTVSDPDIIFVRPVSSWLEKVDGVTRFSLKNRGR